MDVLDDYEDDDYVRLTVHPELEVRSEVSWSGSDPGRGGDAQKQIVLCHVQDGTTTPAYTYIWQQSKASLLYGAWDLDEFREKHLQPYLQMSREFAVEYAAAHGGGAKVGGAGSRSS